MSPFRTILNNGKCKQKVQQVGSKKSVRTEIMLGVLSPHQAARMSKLSTASRVCSNQALPSASALLFLSKLPVKFLRRPTCAALQPSARPCLVVCSVFEDCCTAGRTRPTPRRLKKKKKETRSSRRLPQIQPQELHRHISLSEQSCSQRPQSCGGRTSASAAALESGG